MVIILITNTTSDNNIQYYTGSKKNAKKYWKIFHLMLSNGASLHIYEWIILSFPFQISLLPGAGSGTSTSTLGGGSGSDWGGGGGGTSCGGGGGTSCGGGATKNKMRSKTLMR